MTNFKNPWSKGGSKFPHYLDKTANRWIHPSGVVDPECLKGLGSKIDSLLDIVRIDYVDSPYTVETFFSLYKRLATLESSSPCEVFFSCECGCSIEGFTLMSTIVGHPLISHRNIYSSVEADTDEDPTNNIYSTDVKIIEVSGGKFTVKFVMKVNTRCCS